MRLFLIAGLLFSAVLAHSQNSDNSRALPKLGPKPPVVGTLTTTPAIVPSSTVAPTSVSPRQQPSPSEWKTFSNVVATVELPLPAPASTNTWGKTTAPAARTNLWPQPPPAKGAWK